jgi:hypothetical protein
MNIEKVQQERDRFIENIHITKQTNVEQSVIEHRTTTIEPSVRSDMHENVSSYFSMVLFHFLIERYYPNHHGIILHQWIYLARLMVLARIIIHIS